MSVIRIYAYAAYRFGGWLSQLGLAAIRGERPTDQPLHRSVPQTFTLDHVGGVAFQRAQGLQPNHGFVYRAHREAPYSQLGMDLGR
jgi:hypothetical protein